MINLGDIYFGKENVLSCSYCSKNDYFDYHGIEKPLCGKEHYKYLRGEIQTKKNHDNSNEIILIKE